GRYGGVLDARSWLIPGTPPVAVSVLHDVTRDVRAAFRLRRLNALARELLVAEAGTEVLQRVVDEAATLCEATYSLVLVDAADGLESPDVAHNAAAAAFADALPTLADALDPVLHRSDAIRAVDAGADPRYARLGRGLPGVGPVLSVPIVIGDGVSGRLAVANAADGAPFDARDEALLNELAAHAALAVALSRVRERVREEEQRRSDVADAARHDIRAPITVVKGQISLLRNNLVKMRTSQVNASLNAVEAAVTRVETFATMLLVDEKLQKSAVEPQVEEIDVADVVARLRDDFALLAGQKEVRVDSVVAPGTPATLKADPAMLRQTLDNLVGNAVKFAPPQTTVSIRVRHDDGALHFLVTDRGAGIPENEQHVLFRRFSRTQSSRQRHVPGTGLGLSIVARLVAAHDGSYGVDSRVGEGTTFWVAFPVDGPASGRATTS
ncbi:MAG: ATP-binding protein, partial [Mycobacteriales bacterium]